MKQCFVCVNCHTETKHGFVLHPSGGFMNGSFVIFAMLMMLVGNMASAVDDATHRQAEQKAERVALGLKLSDTEKRAKVKGIAAEWIGTMLSWHKEHDPQLTKLWSDWNKARAVVPKDEFPGEVIAHQIDGVYASLKPAYEDFIKRVSAELSPEQVDAIKENWSRSPGMMRTYNAYVEIVPDLSEKDKDVIKARMLIARESAMLTDSDKEIVAIYKRHKVKVEQYVGTLEWAKLHKAFAERGKAKAADEKASAAEPATKSSAAPQR